MDRLTDLIVIKNHKDVESSLAYFQGRRVFVKKYPRPRNFYSLFKSWFRGTQAACAVTGGHCLSRYGFKTPKVLYLKNKGSALFGCESVAVFEYLDDVSEAAIKLKDKTPGLVKALASEISRLHGLKIIHGDLNLHNLLIRKSGEFEITWIDNRRTRINRILFKRERIRNLSQLYSHSLWISDLTKLKFLAYYRKNLSISKSGARKIAKQVLSRVAGRHLADSLPCCLGLSPELS